MLIKNIQSIDDASFLGMKKIRIKGLTESFIMDINKKGIVEKIKKIIYENKQDQTYSNISPTNEIEKLKELLQQGLITQEEFEQRKQKILGIKEVSYEQKLKELAKMHKNGSLTDFEYSMKKQELLDKIK